MDPAKRERQLRRRVAARYRTIAETLHVGPLNVPFVRIADPDAVLDQVVLETDQLERKTGVRQSDPQHLPYWAELWDSAWGLAIHLTRVAPDWGLTPPNVLDLGCGMGLSGVVAASLGCPVLLADLEAQALLLARLNTARFGRQTRCRRLDWQTDTLDEQFALILGADILYERNQWPFLYRFFAEHLAPGGRVLLGEPGRQTGDGFVQTVADQGWSLAVHPQKTPSRPLPVRIFELTQAR